MRNKTYKRLTGHRGNIKGVQDQIKLAIYSRSCEVCHKTITRKITRAGRFEQWQNFFKRKTCGMLPTGKKSDCLKEWLRGENNPKWRGGLPICKKCGKRTAWYATSNTPQNYCLKCFRKINVINLKRLGKLHKGIYPKGLIPFAFKKGQKAHNKIHDFCTINGCNKKHLAKGLCSKHYQQQKES